MRSIFYSLLCFVSLVPAVVYGQNKIYSPLVDILPGSNDPLSFEQYINFLYGASISIAALLAVVKIIIAGTKYMVSDVIPAKGDALADIQGAILGLLLILGAVIILEFINPQLISRNVTFQSLPERPKLTQNSSVSAALNSSLASLLALCGTVDRSTATQAVVSIDATNCPDSGAVLGAFSRQCMSIANSELDTRHSNDRIFACAFPKTGLGAAGQSPVIEYPMGFKYTIYPICINNCPPITLSDVNIDKAASVGATIVYDAEKQCKTLLGSGYASSDLNSCITNVEKVLFNTCSYTPGSVCNSGWCAHNAGVKASASAGKFACTLPYEKFTSAAVEAEYKKTNPGAIYGAPEFAIGCAALKGTVVALGLYQSGSLADTRCVKR